MGACVCVLARNSAQCFYPLSHLVNCSSSTVNNTAASTNSTTAVSAETQKSKVTKHTID